MHKQIGGFSMLVHPQGTMPKYLEDRQGQEFPRSELRPLFARCLLASKFAPEMRNDDLIVLAFRNRWVGWRQESEVFFIASVAPPAAAATP